VRLPGQLRYRRLPREDWKVFLPNLHPGYLTWEEYEANQVTLRHNARGYGSDRRQSPPREGVALLQGLVVCGRCGDRMTVRYETHQGHPAPVYTCQRRGIATATPVCQVIHGAALDAAISDLVLAAVTPARSRSPPRCSPSLYPEADPIARGAHRRCVPARRRAAQRQFSPSEHRLVADTLSGTGMMRCAGSRRRKTTTGAPARPGLRR
jgi:hypothetical protein